MSEGPCIQGKRLPFEVALARLKEGYPSIAMECWQKGTVVKMQVPDEHSKMTNPYLYMEIYDGEDLPVVRFPWMPNQLHFFDNTWEIRS